MRKKLLLLLAVSTTNFALPSPQLLQERIIISTHNNVVDEIVSGVTNQFLSPGSPSKSLNEVREMLEAQAPNLNGAVINKVLATLECAQAYQVNHNNILTVIDYSLPSSNKRLWVFDLKTNQLLFNTYVSHGIKSGRATTNFFSNKHNSKASSLGVYTTDQSYYGRHGVSLKLDGLERGFNDNAANRAVVMHGGWYVDEDFIKKYGRAGRSWGCPAIPNTLSDAIVNTIKDKSLFVVYYPSEDWFAKSKFLNCYHDSPIKNTGQSQMAVQHVEPIVENEKSENILFADNNKDNRREENEPIVVMEADNYERVFHVKAPLARMLRRQINHKEYIALSNTEFKNMITDNAQLPAYKESLSDIYFVIPVVKMVRGYYATEMQVLNYGKVKEVREDAAASPTDEAPKSYVVQSEAKQSIHLKSTNHFIRWLGL